MHSDLEHGVEALRLSLEQLSHDDRFLILNYYKGDKSDKIKTRKKLSELFGIGASTLRMRAMRIREKLQQQQIHIRHLKIHTSIDNK
jgi:hypothetical protein